MINVEDLRIGDIVQTNKDCMFPKDTLCIVTEIHPDRQRNDKKGVVSLKAVNDEDDGPLGDMVLQHRWRAHHARNT